MLRRDDGFTLIETLVALVILAAAAGIFYQNLEIGTRGSRLATRDATALRIAENKMQEVIALQPGPGSQFSGEDAGGFAWSTSVSDFVAATDAQAAKPLQLHRVDVRVSWREQPGRPVRDLSLTTFVPARSP